MQLATFLYSLYTSIYTHLYSVSNFSIYVQIVICTALISFASMSIHSSVQCPSYLCATSGNVFPLSFRLCHMYNVRTESTKSLAMCMMSSAASVSMLWCESSCSSNSRTFSKGSTWDVCLQSDERQVCEREIHKETW